MRFRNIFSRDADCPEARYIVIEHQTPELLWQPELMQHENGAYGLEEAWLVADDAGVAQRAQALDAVVKVVPPVDFAQRFGWSPPAPCLACITISFLDLAQATRLLTERDGVRPDQPIEALAIDKGRADQPAVLSRSRLIEGTDFEFCKE